MRALKVAVFQEPECSSEGQLQSHKQRVNTGPKKKKKKKTSDVKSDICLNRILFQLSL